MKTRLVLLDIDGTLLSTHGVAVEAMLAAYREVYGVSAERNGFRLDGQTELAIAHQLLGGCGLSAAEIERGLPELWREYPRQLKRRLVPEQITVFPGVREVLAALAVRDEVVVGLLTGNIEAAARIKLEAAGLEGFALGAFGEFYRERSELPGVAVAAAEQFCGVRFQGKAISIVGDTPNDILCGRSLGANAIAVATGRYDLEALRAHGPDHLFSDLSGISAVLSAIEGAPTPTAD